MIRRALQDRRSTSRAPKGQGGFSLIEGLVAMAVLLIVVIGLIPLFTQSMVSNAAGRHLTQASNMATDGFETFLQMPLNNELLTVPSGDMGVVTIQLFGGRLVRDAANNELPSNSLLASFTTGLEGTAPPDTDDLIETARADAASGFTPANLLQADFLRQIVVRQYSISSLSDGIVDEADSRLDQSEQLPGGSGLGNVHFKQVEIIITPRGRADQLSLGRGRITSTVLKSF
jgi:Prokaryotic N-terminal methylation motif